MRPDPAPSQPSGEVFNNVPLPENLQAVTAKTAAAKAVQSARARLVGSAGSACPPTA